MKHCRGKNECPREAPPHCASFYDSFTFFFVSDGVPLGLLWLFFTQAAFANYWEDQGSPQVCAEVCTPPEV